MSTQLGGKNADTLADARLFLETRNRSAGLTATNDIEIVCSSAKHNMDANTKSIALRLFSQTIRLDPHRFTHWPTTTDLCCWHCTEPFDTTPISVPRSQLPGEDEVVYVLYGVFCSANCGARWITSHHRDKHMVLLRFKRMLVDVFKCAPIDVFNLKLAPEAMTLAKFGGPYSLQEFRSKSVTTHVELTEPPFVNYDMVLQEHARAIGGVQPGEQVPSGHQISGLRRPTSMARRGLCGENTLLMTTKTKTSVLSDTTDEPTTDEPTNHTGVCGGLKEGGLYKEFLHQKQIEGSAPDFDTEEKKYVKPATEARSRKKPTTLNVAKAKSVGNVQGTLARFMRPSAIQAPAAFTDNN